MITLNVQRPFIFSKTNPDYRGPGNESGDKARGGNEKRDEKESIEKEKSIEHENTSSLKLIDLFIIFDISSSSSTSEIRHA